MTSVGFGWADPLAGFRALFDVSSPLHRKASLTLGRSSLSAPLDQLDAVEPGVDGFYLALDVGFEADAADLRF